MWRSVAVHRTALLPPFYGLREKVSCAAVANINAHRRARCFVGDVGDRLPCGEHIPADHGDHRGHERGITAANPDCQADAGAEEGRQPDRPANPLRYQAHGRFRSMCCS